jgi:hypothetical protein
MQKPVRKPVSLRSKRSNNYSNDISNSEWETGYGNTGFSADKHLKIYGPLGTTYMSTEPCLIKVVTTAPSENMRANEITIETTKTSKVTVVVMVLSIYCKKKGFAER